jgi:hypothetical protein
MYAMSMEWYSSCLRSTKKEEKKDVLTVSLQWCFCRDFA